MIRPATPGDDVAVGELLVRAFESAYALKMPEVEITEQRRAELRAVAHKRARATVLVLEREGQLLGTVALFRPGAEGTQAWLPNAADLRHLATAPEVHGQKLSSALLDAAERLAWSWGVEAICLHVRRGAVGVSALYQRRGYRREATADLDLPSVFLEALVLRRGSERSNPSSNSPAGS